MHAMMKINMAIAVDVVTMKAVMDMDTLNTATAKAVMDMSTVNTATAKAVMVVDMVMTAKEAVEEVKAYVVYSIMAIFILWYFR